MIITQNPTSPVHESASNSIMIDNFYDIMSALLSAQQGALMGLGRLYWCLTPIISWKEKGTLFCCMIIMQVFPSKHPHPPFRCKAEYCQNFPQKSIFFLPNFPNCSFCFGDWSWAIYFVLGPITSCFVTVTQSQCCPGRPISLEQPVWGSIWQMTEEATI